MSTATLKACQPVQSMGTCQTFVRRYLYTTLFEIVEHDAIEEQTGKPETNVRQSNVQKQEQENAAPAKPPATTEQYELINSFVKDNMIPEKTLEWLKVESNWNNLTESNAKKIITVCNKYRKENS